MKDHREPLVDFIIRQEIKTLVEVGVDQASLQKMTLNRKCQFAKFYMVDPYHCYSGPGAGSFKHHSQEIFDKKYEDVKCFFENYPEYVIIRKTSEDAVKEIKGKLDFVFIDGDHSIEACKLDIGLWMPKIRKGGWIGGDDYSGKYSRLIRKAVHSYFGDVELISRDRIWLRRLE